MNQSAGNICQQFKKMNNKTQNNEKTRQHYILYIGPHKWASPIATKMFYKKCKIKEVF